MKDLHPAVDADAVAAEAVRGTHRRQRGGGPNGSLAVPCGSRPKVERRNATGEASELDEGFEGDNGQHGPDDEKEGEEEEKCHEAACVEHQGMPLTSLAPGSPQTKQGGGGVG